MATLNTNVSLTNMESYYGSGNVWIDQISQANATLDSKINAAISALETEVGYSYSYPIHTSIAYQQIGMPSDTSQPKYVINAAGSGFSYHPNGSFNEADQNFVINTLSADLYKTVSSASPLMTASLTGRLEVTNGELASGQLDSLAIATSNEGSLTLTGPMSFDGTRLTGAAVTMGLGFDSDPSADSVRLVNLTVGGSLNENFATGTSNSVLKSLALSDAYSGYQVSLSGLQMTGTSFDGAGGQSFWSLAGQSGTADTVNSSANFVLPQNWENLVLTGTGRISGTGNGLDNTLKGNSNRNVLRGGAGKDTLIGGTGDDTLFGGTGKDCFKFVTQSEGTDTIQDFVSGVDNIRVVSKNFGNLTVGTLASGHFVRSLSGVAGDSSDRFIFETDTGVLRYDPDGTGALAAVQIAKLNTTNLRASDIFVSVS